MSGSFATAVRSGIAILAGFVALACLSAGSVLAQSTSSSLTGQVRTEDGQPVADAIVQTRSEATGATRSTVSDEDGRYRIDSLSPGTWTVVARLADGRVSESRVVRLHLQQTVQLDFTVGAGLTERVTVTAEVPLIDPRETAGRLRIGSEKVNSLPLSGRVFTDLALLDSSVQPAAPGLYFGERGSVFAINGQSGRSNSFLVDGLDNNDQTSGTTLNAFYSQQVIEEFVLLTHQYSPEFGRASGGVLNIVTRRGGNEPGWEAFVQGSSARWNEPGDFVDSLPESGTSRDAASRLQTGFNLSGPFKKDRAFYFLAYEHADLDDLIPYTGVLREDVGNFDARGGGRLLAPASDDNLFFRADFNLGPAHTLMVRFSADDRETEGVNVGGVRTPESGFRIAERDIGLAASLTSILSPSLIAESRFLAARSVFDQFANSDRPGVERPAGVFGGNNLNLQNRDEDRFQLVENLTWSKGEHTLKFGLDVTRSRTRLHARFNPNGNFLYNSDYAFQVGDCGGVFPRHVDAADDPTAVDNTECSLDDNGVKANILSYPLVYTYIFGEPEALLDDTRIGLFAQDRWKVGPWLLLDYGLRYDLSTFVLPPDAAVDSVIPNGGSGRDTDNIAPRLGFTFTPAGDERLVIRGGGGVFYDKLVLAFPAVAGIMSGTEIALLPMQGYAFEIDDAFVEDNGIESLDLETLKTVFSHLIMRFSTGTELETPYTVQFNLGMDMATGKRSALGLDMVQALGYHLPLMVDLNPVSGLVNSDVCSADRIDPSIEPYQGVPCHLGDTETGSIASIVTEGRSWYRGIDLGWRWQGESSWFSTSYTFSRAEDMGFDPLKGGLALPPDSGNLAAERGRADGDRRHRLVLSGDTALPWMGLRLATVWQYSSGLPFNVTTGTDDNVDGILTDRPPGVRRNTGEDTPLGPINQVRMEYNEDLPPEHQLEPITSLEEPYFSQIDLRMYRKFPFSDGRGTGEFYVQVFNLLNRENAGLIEGRAISRNFGRTITLAGPPRSLELGLKLSY